MPRDVLPLYIGDLVDCQIITAEGKRLGRVVDVLITPEPPYRVLALDYGLSSWLARLRVLSAITRLAPISHTPKTVPLRFVDRYERYVVYLKPGYDPKDTRLVA